MVPGARSLPRSLSETSARRGLFETLSRLRRWRTAARSFGPGRLPGAACGIRVTAGTPRASRSSGSSPPPSPTPACCPPCWPSWPPPGCGCRCRCGSARLPTAPRSGCRWSATPRPTSTSCPASPRCSASPRGRTTSRRTRAAGTRTTSTGSRAAAGGSGSGRATPGWYRTWWSPRPASPGGCRPASAWRSTPTARPASRCTRSPSATWPGSTSAARPPSASATPRPSRLPCSPRCGPGCGGCASCAPPPAPGSRSPTGARAWSSRSPSTTRPASPLTGPSSARCWRPSRRCRCTSPTRSTSPSPASPPTTRRSDGEAMSTARPPRTSSPSGCRATRAPSTARD